jgi:hypothetical protein
MKTITKLLRQNTKTKRTRNVSAPKKTQNAVPRNTNHKPAPVVAIGAAPGADDHAERLKRKLELINEVYQETMHSLINQRATLPKKKAMIRRNIFQFAGALAGWWCEAVDLLDSSQQAALIRMLPDLKASTDSLMRVD